MWSGWDKRPGLFARFPGEAVGPVPSSVPAVSSTTQPHHSLPLPASKSCYGIQSTSVTRNMKLLSFEVISVVYKNAWTYFCFPAFALNSSFIWAKGKSGVRASSGFHCKVHLAQSSGAAARNCALQSPWPNSVDIKVCRRFFIDLVETRWGS